ncbi:phospholipase D family protein [Acinetobacter bereziniae]|uniref:phospholipase D family protein n=1 Tax=Acinetobacter TaxID=469 RepID=UPI0015808340|nr:MULTISPECIES: phospholipase D family protein [Acinetobacter]MCM8510628.1 phospholipase D family protein [Acinetobacter bereziniae]MDR3030010.1 phospholipase D family protein [Acinetobacter sp.]NUF64535.1 phospholipase D family protein [Acinetobacter bereziniae]NUG08638.1 phospholipase D family protein [Acinetobacter bereziniae]NUG65104.1 phospholipase D family protein [Acinetobacter bereziniae]
MNQSQQEQQSQIYQDHWITEPQAKNMLTQGLTAYLAMNDAFQSIASRIHLIRKAKYTLDLQYYIWADDFIGNLMLHELLKAADRGVKVRLLIDDQNGTKIDRQLSALLTHPNISIKLYNPYKFRHFRVMDYIFRAQRINHRMHNKLIIADGAIAVTGGRNISSEYFDASESFQFTDMDVLFFGQSVNRANEVFTEFWNFELSYPIEQFISKGSAQDLIDLRKSFEKLEQAEHSTDEKVNLEQKELANELNQNKINWAYADFLADSPKKSLGKAQGNELISHQIHQHLGDPKQEMDLIAAYFVPTQNGTDFISQFPKQNVNVRILTNSFVANDVALVHAFYQKYRVELLKNGAKLYEFKPYIERKRRTWYEVVTGNIIPKKGKNKSSLHAKFINIDDKVFIGSFNLDPRSFNINTEVGLVLKSDPLQEQISDLLDRTLLTVAYEVQLNSQGELIWLDYQADGKVIEHHVDPETTRFQRFMMYSVSYLPLEWMM